MSYKETHIGESNILGQPKKPMKFIIAERAVKTRHLDDGCVNTSKIADKAVTPAKVSDDFQGTLVLPVTNSIDKKYTDITEELYSMIASLQVGGIALSNQFGNREDIGITQKALTRMFGALWDTIESLHPGHAVFDFTLTVNPQYIFNETVEDHVSVKADCTGAVSDFDSVKVYVNDELRAESRNIRVFETTVIITETSTIKVVGTILGREIVKTAQVINEIPFFMGGGMQYTDIMNEECRKEIEGTLEGEYDATISSTGQYLFVIIPISRKEEFRRCKMDMNGFEIPIEVTEMTDYIVCKSLNQYQAGTYNIDIDINS
jgi:hypothetical protein